MSVKVFKAEKKCAYCKKALAQDVQGELMILELDEG